MVSLSQKLKFQKHAKKTFYKNIRVVLCKKTARKNKYWRNENILKISQRTKGITHAKAVNLGQKLKMPKTCEKPFYKNFRVVQCKKPLEKTPNIPETRQF